MRISDLRHGRAVHTSGHRLSNLERSGPPRESAILPMTSSIAIWAASGPASICVPYQFVAEFFASVDAGGTMKYVSCGHEAAIFIGHGGHHHLRPRPPARTDVSCLTTNAQFTTQKAEQMMTTACTWTCRRSTCYGRTFRIRTRPMGAHGVGEIGITGMAPAVANAVHNATGQRIRNLPITLEKLPVEHV